MPGTTAVEQSIQAFLPHEDSEDISNPIHSSATAQRYGFKAALVGGVTVWGWATPAIMEALGPGWLDRGWADFAFRQPTYPGDTLAVRVAPGSDAGPDAWSVTMTNQDGVLCVVASVGLGDAPWIDEYVTPGRLAGQASPSPKPPLELASAPVGQDWRGMGEETPVPEAREFSSHGQRSTDALFIGERPRLHPAFIAGRAERIMRHNVSIPNSIHTRSRIQHLAPAYAGQRITTGARFLEAYERKGHHIANFDCLVQGQDGTALARLRHWTIFRVAPPAERS
ncbi:MAG: MaoC family dehydratase [Dehalococcoidia bacterium]|nr:MaoC family dehydratase [Dehalococcoidia bacterium]